jgi:hypothetical protein
VAEAVGFEPTVAFTTHDFQSCRFGRSRTPPGMQPGQASRGPRRPAGGLACRGGTAPFWVRWPGPAQRPLVNRVRVGRQQLSAGMAGCRSQPGRRTEHRRQRSERTGRLGPMADVPFVSLYRRFRPGDSTSSGPGPRGAGAAECRARRPGVARLPLQRAPGHRQDLVGPHPGQGAQLRVAGRRRAVRGLHLVHRDHPGHLARRARAGRGVQQRRGRHARPGGPRRPGHPGTLEGLHRRRGPHALQRGGQRAAQDARRAARATWSSCWPRPTRRRCRHHPERTQHLEFRLLGAETLQTLLESVRDQAGTRRRRGGAAGRGAARARLGP